MAALLSLVLAVPPALTLLTPDEALARARSSGGYSRPAVRTPSVSRAPRGGADLDVSRRGSAEALQRYRAQSEPMYTRRPSAAPPAERESRRGYAPVPSYGGGGLGGLGNAMLMWFLLDSLNRPANAQYFHDHQDDPAYRAWRQEADSRAQADPELRAKLQELDGQLAQRQGQPRNPAAQPPQPESGGGGTFLVVALLGGVLVVLWFARRRRAESGALDLAKGMARQKMGLEPDRASPYRLGMTLTLDPAPFILAGSAIKAHPPAGTTGSVTALGRLEGAAILDRLYLTEGFFQLHRVGGQVDECRWFSPLDQITPADEQEWAFWLDRAEGMLGWPTFETKDGTLYDRAWMPGSHRIEPHAFTERVTEVTGTTSRRLSVMLYAASTGAAPPAPETEYILVAAVEDTGRAWIEIHAGIDINAAGLSLPT